MDSVEIKNLKMDVSNLNEYLRNKHIEGVDLYLKNTHNTKTKDYYKGGLNKEQAQEKYEKDNFKKTKCNS